MSYIILCEVYMTKYSELSDEQKEKIRKNHRRWYKSKGKEYYQKNKGKVRKWQMNWIKKNWSEMLAYQRDYRKRKFSSLKRKFVQMLGGKCQQCGYNKYLEVLEFHHINPKDKESNDHEWRRFPKKFEEKIESGKIMLLCSNCHQEKHLGEN